MLTDDREALAELQTIWLDTLFDAYEVWISEAPKERKAYVTRRKETTDLGLTFVAHCVQFFGELDNHPISPLAIALGREEAA